MASPRNSYLNKKNMDKTCSRCLLRMPSTYIAIKYVDFFYIALINDKFYNYFL